MLGFQTSFPGFLLNWTSSALFGMYLTPQAIGNAELTIGGVDDSKFTGK